MILKSSKFIALLSHVAPLKPSGQLQENLFPRSTQVPPFTHGLLSHSLMFAEICLNADRRRIKLETGKEKY